MKDQVSVPLGSLAPGVMPARAKRG